MVIGGQNIKNIDGLIERLKKENRSEALRDIVAKSYEFFEFIAYASDELSFVNEDVPINELKNNILIHMLEAAKKCDTEQFVEKYYLRLFSWVEKYYQAVIKTDDIEIEIYDEKSLCNCLIIVIWAKEVGINIELQEILQFVKKRQAPPPPPPKSSDSHTVDGVTVAASNNHYGYLENGIIYVVDSFGNKRQISAKDALSIQIDGDGSVIYIKRQCEKGVNNIVALSDEEYPSAAAIAISVKDFQFAYILKDGTLKTNIPFARGVSADGIIFKNVFVCKNLLLAITADDRVFSGDHGILAMSNIKKATAGAEGNIAYLTHSGEVYINSTERCIAKNALDIEYCKHGLVISFQEHISIWREGRINILAEASAIEMAVSDTGVVYRIKDGSAHICKF